MRKSKFTCLPALIAVLLVALVPSTDLRKELTYMQNHNPAFSGVGLVNGTERFNPDLVGAILGS